MAANISKNFGDYLKDQGIRHEYTIQKTPEQNGVAERTNRTLVEMVRSMLSDSSLLKVLGRGIINYWIHTKLKPNSSHRRNDTI